MSDERFPLDSTSGTSKLKRKIPPVTEVLDELARSLKADPYGKANLFDAAQRVCADELKRLKTEGGEPTPLRTLVDRARWLLDPAHRGRRDSGEEPPPDREEGPFDLSAPPETSEPFTLPPPPEGFTPFSSDAPALSPATADDAASIVFELEPPSPISRKAVPVEPATGQMPAPEGPNKDDSPGRRLSEPARLAGPTVVGRISPSGPSRDAAGSPVLLAGQPSKHPALRGFLWVLAAVVLLGGGYYFLRIRPASAVRSAPITRRAAGRQTPLPAKTGGSVNGGSPGSSPARPGGTGVPSAPEASGSSSAAAPIVRTAEKPVAGASREASEERHATGVGSSAGPAPVRQGEASQSRAGNMVSRDWAGRAPVYMVHFSSYKSRENANRDAERLAKKFERPAHVLLVDLGSEGVWYRVMVGDFASEEEAFSFRADLASRKTPDLGLVFRVAAPAS